MAPRLSHHRLKFGAQYQPVIRAAKPQRQLHQAKRFETQSDSPVLPLATLCRI
jgi:hypothetical protein